MDFFEDNNPFLNNSNIENIDNSNGNDNLQQNSVFENSEDKYDKIIINKRVKSIRQLKNIEKELVRLNYKEAIIKGLGNNLIDIQNYILSKTHILVERNGLEYLKKSEERENREFYYYMAKDHFAYVGAYRKCMDEIEQLKKELWNIIMDPKTEYSIRIHALKELHSLSRTFTLLIRDLPFVTNLSKQYDKDILNSKYNNPVYPKITHSNKNNQICDKNIINERNYNKIKRSVNQIDLNGVKDGKTSLGNNTIEVDNMNLSKYKNLDDEITKDMQRQVHVTDSLKGKSSEELSEEEWDNLITPEHKVLVRKLQELFDD